MKFKGSFTENKLHRSLSLFYSKSPSQIQKKTNKDILSDFILRGEEIFGKKLVKKEKLNKKILAVLKKVDKKLYKKSKKTLMKADTFSKVVKALNKTLDKMFVSIKAVDPLPSWKKHKPMNTWSLNIGLNHPKDRSWHYKNDQSALYYASTGHKDQFLRTMNEMKMKYQTTSIPFKKIDLSKVGDCSKCHPLGIKEKFDEFKTPFEFNRIKEKRLVRFNHQPHNRVACKTCHRLEDSKSVATSHPLMINDFKTLKKVDCTQCHHHREEAGFSCLQCHNYHASDITAEKQLKQYFQTQLNLK